MLPAAGNVALAVTEAATNIIKHAQRGKLLLRGLEHGGIGGLELLALDQGPASPTSAAACGTATPPPEAWAPASAPSAEVSHSMDVYTQPGKGTAVRLEFWAGPSPSRDALPELGAVSFAKSGEVACGDAWALGPDGADRSLLVLTDSDTVPMPRVRREWQRGPGKASGVSPL